MFAKFDYTLFPCIVVKFSEYIKDDEDFRSFLSEWESIYNRNQDFIFVFDTNDVGIPPIRYCIMMSSFIRSLRSKNLNYLKKSIIIVNNKGVVRLLDLIFYIQPPLAMVHLTEEKLETVLINIECLNKIKITKNIKPGKPLLPFL